MTNVWTIRTSTRNPRAPEKGGVSQADFEKLRSMFPECEGKTVLSIQLAEGDDRLQAFLSKAREMGLKLQESKAELHPEIGITVARKYNANELDEFKYFQVFPQLPIAEATKGNGTHPMLRIDSDIVAEGNPFGFLSPYWWVVCCDQDGRALLNTIKFRGLELIDLGNTSKPLWLLWSNSQMGMIQNECFDNDGNRFDPTKAAIDLPNGCLPLEGNYGTPNLIFRREDCVDLDVALTRERFSPSKRTPCWPSLVVSQKFKKALDTIPGLSFVPVRVID